MDKAKHVPHLLPRPVAVENVCHATPVGLATVSHRVFTEVNDCLCQMLGYRREEMIGNSTRMMYPSDEAFQQVGNILFADVEAHGAAVIEARLVCKDGNFLEAFINLSRPGPAGDGSRHFLSVLDISQPRRAEHDLFWQNRELTAFHRISEVMLSGQDEQSIFNTIAREAADMTAFPMVSIELCDFDRAVMVYRGAHGITLDEMPVPFEVPMDVALSGQVAHTGEVLVEKNVAARREYAAPIVRHLGVQTFVCVPIKTDGRVVGTLSLSHPKPIEVEPRVVKAATGLANYLATLFDRLHAREVARQSETELASVYDRVPSMLCLFDEQMRIVRANRAAVEFTGHTQTSPAGMRLGEFFCCLAVQSAPQSCGHEPGCDKCNLQQILKDTLVTGKSLRQVRMAKTLPRDGHSEEVVLLVSTERIQLNGMIRALLCLEDVTQNVRADEQIRAQAALLDITREAIFVRDFSSRITYWNEGAHRLYGWTAAEAQQGTTTELQIDADPFESTRALQAVQKQEEWSGELRQKSRDGRVLVIQSRWTLMRDDLGRPKAILVVNTDITEKKLEAQLLRGQRLESIGTLASGLAHDLNNVLAPIMMAVQFLKENTQDDGTRTCLQTLETCSQRGADIIRQVLMFARGVEGERVLLNPKHLIREMERIARETFPRAIEIQVSLSRQPCVVLGDATQIQQVLMNLCVNARDAMPQGGTLTVGLEKIQLDEAGAGLHPKARPGSFVVISVADTGTGIAPELLDKIFDPFFTTKPLGQGTGLGLPTVLGIVENHGGFLHLESQPGKGTMFQAFLPAVVDQHATTGDDGDLGGKPLEKGNDELILVVDDELSLRRLICTVLNRGGYRTITAAHGNEGMAVFEQQRTEIRLVVSDLMMPQLDGPGMIRRLRQMQPEIKTIVVTGLGEENRIAEAKAAGANLILNKPFTGEQLLGGVKQLLG